MSDDATGTLTQPNRPSFASRMQQHRADALLMLPFLLFFFVQLAHHQMWRDETNAWALAANSPTLGRLFHYTHFEAHPYLWYVLLWLVSRWSTALVALKCIEAAIVTCTYGVLGFASPFSRPQKILLYCSYYVSFEYAVITRMYGLMLLLVLLYLHSRTRYPERPVRNAFLLGLLANTDTMGLLLGLALGLEYVLALLPWPKSSVRRTTSPRQRWWLAAAVYVGMLCLSLACLVPSRQVSFRTTGRPFVHAFELKHLSRAANFVLLHPWYPLDPGAPHTYWVMTHARHFSDVLFALAIPAIILQFRREKRLLLTLGFHAVMLILFMHLIYFGYIRHFGTMFVSFLAALWLQRAENANSPGGSQSTIEPSSLFAFVPLGLNAWAGIIAAYASWTHPFSQASATAGWLRAHDLATAPLVGTPDYSVANVGEHLGRPVYFLDCSCTDSFTLFSNRRDDYSAAQLPQRLAQAFAETSRAINGSGPPFVIYIGTVPLARAQLDQLMTFSLSLTPMVSFTGAEEPEENFYLYRAEKAPPVF